MSRPLTKQQLEAVIYAVESLCGFTLIDSAGAIRKLCDLDPRVRDGAAPHCESALTFACGLNLRKLKSETNS